MKVVFVCTGNTCRSPMIRFMFESYLKSMGEKDISVDSAGTMQHEKPMSAETEAVLRLHKIAYGKNISKFCSEALLDGADFIFTMTREQAAKIEELYGSEFRVIPLADIIGQDVPVPYGLGAAAYESVYNIFESALPQIYQYMQK